MNRPGSVTPDSCPYCPHYNPFHGACRHPMRQVVVSELSAGDRECPVFGEVRATAMRALEDRLD